jgi:hypothetical protein
VEDLLRAGCGDGDQIKRAIDALAAEMAAAGRERHRPPTGVERQ